MTNSERFWGAFNFSATRLRGMSVEKFLEWLEQECDVPDMSFGEWIPLKQKRNRETGRYEFAFPTPKNNQHILVTVTCKGHEPVQDDYWRKQGTYGHLDSGYRICDDVIAWMPMPEPYRRKRKA